MQRRKIVGLLILVFISVIFIKGSVFAIPTLQIYIEGSAYDATTDTWITTSFNPIIWVLGDVGHYGAIYDVELAMAYISNETGSISFTPTQATSILDPSIPSLPVFSNSGVGNQPTMGNGKLLPSHGIYGPGTSWFTYSLGNFTLTDSPIGDYTGDACPDGSCTYPDLGQINAYEVTITGYSWVHFDTFDHIEGNPHGKYKYVFAPFSHDGEATPEPATLSLLGLGLLGLIGLRKRGRENA